MTLREKRVLFTRLLAQLIRHINSVSGYEAAIDFVKRCPTCPVGHSQSLHHDALAVDINLYRNGKWLPSTAAHKSFGEYWEGLHPLCRWGGRFNDGNHYSIEHRGMR